MLGCAQPCAAWPNSASPRVVSQLAELNQRVDGGDVTAGLAVLVVDESFAGAAVAGLRVEVDVIGVFRGIAAGVGVELGQLEAAAEIDGQLAEEVAAARAVLGDDHGADAVGRLADPQ